jgi:hypothetical protein
LPPAGESRLFPAAILADGPVSGAGWRGIGRQVSSLGHHHRWCDDALGHGLPGRYGMTGTRGETQRGWGVGGCRGGWNGGDGADALQGCAGWGAHRVGWCDANGDAKDSDKIKRNLSRESRKPSETFLTVAPGSSKSSCASSNSSLPLSSSFLRSAICFGV